MSDKDHLNQAALDEIDEDAVEEGMSFEELEKLRNFKIAKGLGRISLVSMARRISKEAEDAPAPKKVINRLNYNFWKTALKTNDPATQLAYFKEAHDRLDGKAAQAVNLGNHEGKALTLLVAQADTNVL